MEKLNNKIKNYLWHIRRFKKKNEATFIMNIVSIVIVVSYLVTNIFPSVFVEIFAGADAIYNIIATLALSCIASTIFYIIQTYIPNIHKDKLREKDEAEHLIGIMNIMQAMHSYIQFWNYGDIEEDKEPLERFDIAVKYLEDSYEEIINEILKFKNLYSDICNEKIYDFLSTLQRDPNFKMFNCLAKYRNMFSNKEMVFSEKATDILLRYILKFQNIEGGWLVKQDSERIYAEFEYRHISLNGMMCDKKDHEECNSQFEE